MAEYLLTFVGVDTNTSDQPAAIRVDNGHVSPGDVVLSAVIITPPTSGALGIGFDVTGIFNQFPARSVPAASNITVNGTADTTATIITQAAAALLPGATILALMQRAGS